MAARRLGLDGRVVATPVVAAFLVGACTQGAIPTFTPRASSAGPTSVADWHVRQGFGGASGTHQILLNVQFIPDHPGQLTRFDLGEDKKDVAVLVAWLDEHPSTPCWAQQHDSIRTTLAAIEDGYDTLIAAAEAGNDLPPQAVAAMVRQATAADAMTMPSGCP